MRRANIAFIIHIFAFLHAAVALTCRLAGIEDELLLTILTMAMVLLICQKKNLSIEFSAASVIVANIIGYLLGNIGAEILEKFISSPYAVHALSTAATTEVLGWSIALFSKLFRHDRSKSTSYSEDSYLKWIIMAMAGIFVLRVGIIIIFSRQPFSTMDMVNATIRVFSNSWALITIFCINIIYVRYNARFTKSMARPLKVIILVCFMLTVSVLETLVVSEVTAEHASGFWRAFPSLFATSLMAQITVYCIVFMVNYALTTRLKMQKERGKANMAQYRYMKLKQQVNPHFLFNSLNILDCLVCEEQTEKASLYIHKLAGIYRYMIKSEDEEVVPLRDEITFVEQYIDLLSIRFPEGFNVQMSIQEELTGKYVLPCALQLLIENATKHNAVNTENPLTIKVEADEASVRVTNNINPKVGLVESTGLGLKYLRQQYLDICGKNIAIEQTDGTFSVTLPLI